MTDAVDNLLPYSQVNIDDSGVVAGGRIAIGNRKDYFVCTRALQGTGVCVVGIIGVFHGFYAACFIVFRLLKNGNRFRRSIYARKVEIKSAVDTNSGINGKLFYTLGLNNLFMAGGQYHGANGTDQC